MDYCIIYEFSRVVLRPNTHTSLEKDPQYLHTYEQTDCVFSSTIIFKSTIDYP